MVMLSISTGCLPRLENRQFFELASVVRMMKWLVVDSAVDGFEFVLLPEWSREGPPLTLSSAPVDCEKHAGAEIAEMLEAEDDFPILSVHANRDIGNYLCSDMAEDVKKGVRFAEECLSFARKVNAKVCVFHLWDTSKESLDLVRLESFYRKLQSQFTDVAVSVENIPTKCHGMGPFKLVRGFKHKTLDLKWASMYDEFDLFMPYLDEVDNVHIQGRLESGRLRPSVGDLNYEKALEYIKEHDFDRIFTVELEGAADHNAVVEYLGKLSVLASGK